MFIECAFFHVSREKSEPEQIPVRILGKWRYRKMQMFPPRKSRRTNAFLRIHNGLRFELNFNVATRFTRPQRALVTRKILYKNKKYHNTWYVKTMKFLFIRADTRVTCCAYSYIVSSPSPRGKRHVKVRQNVTTITTYKTKSFIAGVTTTRVFRKFASTVFENTVPWNKRKCSIVHKITVIRVKTPYLMPATAITFFYDEK